MPIAAVPAGIDIRKLTSTQAKALEKFIKDSGDNSLARTALLVGLPTLAFVGIAAGAGFLIWHYVKDIELPTGQEIAELAGGGVANAIIDAGGAVLATVAPELANKPTTPKMFTLPSGQVVELTVCQRWEYDSADLLALIQSKGDMSATEITVAALSVLRIVKNMKKAGCSRPSSITAAQWAEG
jgi:hypothetical protein